MTLPARFSLLHSELNDFLFASLGDEQNGMPLNVVSALTRLGVDPWTEEVRPARGFTASPRGRGARASDRSVAYRSTAAIGRFSDQPAAGRALAHTRACSRAAGQC